MTIEVPLLRFAVLASQQNAQRFIVMQISAVIIEQSICHYILANNPRNCTNKVSGSEVNRRPFLNLLRVSLTCYANYKVPALPKMGLFRCTSANIAIELRAILRAQTEEIVLFLRAIIKLGMENEEQQQQIEGVGD